MKHLLMKSVLSLDFQHLSDIGLRLEADMIQAANVVPIQAPDMTQVSFLAGCRIHIGVLSAEMYRKTVHATSPKLPCG